jgi:hypothetical protein
MRSGLLIIFGNVHKISKSHYCFCPISLSLSFSLSAYPSVRHLSIRLSMCLPFRMKQPDRSGKIFMRFSHFNFVKSCRGNQLSLNYDSNSGYFIHLTPNGHISGRTASLNSKRCILYIYSTNIRTECFKHAAHSPFLPLQNAVYFIMLPFFVFFFIHILYTGCLKI